MLHCEWHSKFSDWYWNLIWKNKIESFKMFKDWENWLDASFSSVTITQRTFLLKQHLRIRIHYKSQRLKRRWSLFYCRLKHERSVTKRQYRNNYWVPPSIRRIVNSVWVSWERNQLRRLNGRKQRAKETLTISKSIIV